MEEVGGKGEGLRDVCKHVGHALIDASSIRASIDSLAILGECGKVEGFGGAIPAKVGQLPTVVESVVERRVLRGKFSSG